VTLAHGSLEAQKALVQTIRAEADAVGRPVAILVDLPGPKVRTTAFASEVELERDAIVTLVAGRQEPSRAERFVVDYPTLVEDVQPGDLIGIGDGAVQLQVESRGGSEVTTRVQSGGRVSGRKGVKLPAARLRATVPTEEDLELIAAFRGLPVDVVAVSFVRSADDVTAVRRALGPNPPWVMAKIETAAAVENLRGVIEASDAVMVARGDLGTELPIEDVPHLQKRIIHDTVRSGKPVLVATQMLESMIQAPAPTRAEATDVANAVLDNTSAVMLSAETAVGHDPVAVVRTMARLITRAEQELQPAQLEFFALDDRPLSDPSVAISHAAWHAANDLRPAAILCCTRTGATARHMASCRPLTPLYGLTADRRALRQLSLCWGVQPLFQAEVAPSTEAVMRAAVDLAARTGVLKPGEIAIVLAGSPAEGPGHTDTLRVVTVGA
jgi:pyruvate kinase